MAIDPVRLSPEFVKWCEEFNAALASAAIEFGRRMEPLVEAYRNDMRRFAERVTKEAPDGDA